MRSSMPLLTGLKKCAKRKKKLEGGGEEEGDGVEKNSLAQNQAWSGVRPPYLGPHSRGDVKRNETRLKLEKLTG